MSHHVLHPSNVTFYDPICGGAFHLPPTRRTARHEKWHKVAIFTPAISTPFRYIEQPVQSLIGLKGERTRWNKKWFPRFFFQQWWGEPSAVSDATALLTRRVTSPSGRVGSDVALERFVFKFASGHVHGGEGAEEAGFHLELFSGVQGKDTSESGQEEGKDYHAGGD